MKNILENLAIDLYNAGYKVAFWSEERYNESWRKNDMTSIVAGKTGDSNIVCASHEGLGYGTCGMVDYSQLYIPCRKHGSGALAGSGEGNMEEFEKAMSQPLDFEKEIKRYDDIDDWMKKTVFNRAYVKMFKFLDPKKHKDKFIRKYILDHITHEAVADEWDDDMKVKRMLNVIHDTLGEMWNNEGPEAAIEHYMRGLGHGFTVDFETHKQKEFLDKIGVAYSEENLDKVFYKLITNKLITFLI